MKKGDRVKVSLKAKFADKGMRRFLGCDALVMDVWTDGLVISVLDSVLIVKTENVEVPGDQVPGN